MAKTPVQTPVKARTKPAVIAAGLIAAAAASTTAAASLAAAPGVSKLPAGAAGAPGAPEGDVAAMGGTSPAPALAPAPAPAPAPASAATADASQPYIVRSVPIRHDGKSYGTGFEIALTEAQALRLGPLVTPVNFKE